MQNRSRCGVISNQSATSNRRLSIKKRNFELNIPSYANVIADKRVNFLGNVASRTGLNPIAWCISDPSAETKI
jgi:hypothetical protein